MQVSINALFTYRTGSFTSRSQIKYHLPNRVPSIEDFIYPGSESDYIFHVKKNSSRGL